MITLFVVLPLIIAAFLALVLRNEPKAVKYIAFLSSIVTLGIAVYLFLSPAAVQSFTWFNVGALFFNISTSTAPINMFMLMLVSIITPLIFLYSIGFMETPSEQPRFYFEICIFAASMMLFAISSNLITMFIAWEMLGITSYMLIGFWYQKEKAPTAARKAITTILIGDIAMLIGILIIGATYGTFEFSALLSLPASSSLSIGLVLILIGAFTKSAQFPFHEWLPDAMEGPTPVSAFLHSSTMVKAGVFLIAVLLPLYVEAGLLDLILVVGIISALLGVSNALAEKHIKKVLAYSTIEDLGLMFIALGLNAFVAAMMLFFVQTFYKALLFMNAGSIMKANDEREDIYHIYGATVNKSVFITLLIGVLSIAGIFPLSGFFGKNLLESSANNIAVYLLLLVIELGTSLYIFRWLFVMMKKSYESEGAVTINYKSLPKTMIIPTYVLAILVVGGSAFYTTLPTYLSTGSLSYSSITIESAAIGTVVALLGIIIAYRIYKQGHRMHFASTNKTAFSILYNSTIVNGAYLRLIEVFTYLGGVIGYNDFAFDKSTYGLAQATVSSGNILKKIVNGQLNLYVLGFVLGLMLLLVAFAL
ncbi:MAG: NADH-quinone oxidoreductase subunit L [Candidatus Micrarchaeales archaeon]